MRFCPAAAVLARQLKDIDLTETNGLDEFKSELETIDGDLNQLANDAKSEFSSQVDAVTSSFEALGASVQAATADPTADTLAVRFGCHPVRGMPLMSKGGAMG